MVRLQFILVSALIALATGSAAPAEQPATLPDLECVRLLRQARLAEGRGSPEEALEILRTALDDFPKEVTVLADLMAYHRRHGLEEDEAALLQKKLLDRFSDPDTDLPPGTLGFLVANEEAPPEEMEAILASLKHHSSERTPDAETLRHIAILETRLNRLEEARATLGKLLAIKPTWPLRQDCLNLDIHLERWADAASLLEKHLETNKSPFYRGMYIMMLGKLGRYEEILEQTELLEHGPHLDIKIIRGWVDDMLIQSAWNLRDAGRDEEAGALFRRVLAADEDNKEVQTVLLHLYSTEEDRQAMALEVADLWAREQNPDKLLAEAVDRVAAGDLEGGIDLLERAATLQPNLELAWYNLGLAALRLERWETAETAFANSSRLLPSRVESALYHGAALQALGRNDEAIVELNRAQAMDPDTDLPEVHFYLYRCHRGLQDARSAARELALYNESRRE